MVTLGFIWFLELFIDQKPMKPNNSTNAMKPSNAISLKERRWYTKIKNRHNVERLALSFVGLSTL